MDIKELGNGSDIRGVALNALNENVNLTTFTEKSIGLAFTKRYSSSTLTIHSEKWILSISDSSHDFFQNYKHLEISSLI
jgi:hypothetical protein